MNFPAYLRSLRDRAGLTADEMNQAEGSNALQTYSQVDILPRYIHRWARILFPRLGVEMETLYQEIRATGGWSDFLVEEVVEVYPVGPDSL